MTKKLSPSIALEKDLGAQIYDALQGRVVEAIRDNASNGEEDIYWRSRMEGHCMKVEKAVLPDFWRLCTDVKTTLGFNEPVDFYVTGDSSINAFSVEATEAGNPHIVNINSGMIDIMSEEELRFVIGHELGHIINKDLSLRRLIYFVFPPDTTAPPLALEYKIRLHDQLAELVADRYGFLASGNLNACVTAFYKMSSGLDLGKMDVSIDALLKDNRKHLDYFLKDKGLSRYDHPVNPIRIEAIKLYASATDEKELEAGMNELLEILLQIGNGPMDADLSVFFATAGIIFSNVDDDPTKEEYEHIIQNLSGVQIFPKKYLAEMHGKDVVAKFNESANNILKKAPGMREALLFYLIGLVMSDRKLLESEVILLYNVGRGLGFSDKDISMRFADMIRNHFTPSLDSIG